MLQPSFSSNARISVICTDSTVNPDVSAAIAESTSTLLFTKRVKNIQVGPMFFFVNIRGNFAYFLLIVTCTKKGSC